MHPPAPTTHRARIESLDVIRGFAVLGILLLNILGFGMHTSAYGNPGFDLTPTLNADLFAWAGVEIFAEGSMRAIFSMLFGAGVLLFVGDDDAKPASLHYTRMAWLLAFGLFDAYLLFWPGDILVTYALAGGVLYLFRHASARALLVSGVAMLLVMSAINAWLVSALDDARRANERFEQGEVLTETQRQAAADWREFIAEQSPPAHAVAREITERRANYAAAFYPNMQIANRVLFEYLPWFLFWDALVMMLFGMALYKFGVLQGRLRFRAYLGLTLAGFALGLALNAREVFIALKTDFDVLHAFMFLQPTYHIGRLGMALGYIGALMLLLKSRRLQNFTARLALVGRMALTHYLGQSLFCLLIFSGAGLALVGELSRAQLYLVVALIWLVQIWLSGWWLARRQMGPLESIWRRLTYGAAAVRR